MLRWALVYSIPIGSMSFGWFLNSRLVLGRWRILRLGRLLRPLGMRSSTEGSPQLQERGPAWKASGRKFWATLAHLWATLWNSGLFFWATWRSRWMQLPGLHHVRCEDCRCHFILAVIHDHVSSSSWCSSSPCS